MSLADDVTLLNEINNLLNEINDTLKDTTKTLGASTTEEAGRKLGGFRGDVYGAYLMSRRLVASLRRFGLPDNLDAALGRLMELERMLQSLDMLARVITASTFTTPTGMVFGAVYALSWISQLITMGSGHRR